MKRRSRDIGGPMVLSKVAFFVLLSSEPTDLPELPDVL